MIAVTFSELTPQCAQLLMRYYEEIGGGQHTRITGTAAELTVMTDDDPSDGAMSAVAAFSGANGGADAHALAAAAFAASAPTAAPTPAPQPVAAPAPVMTDAAQFTYDQYIASGWTDQALIDNALMVAPVPNVPAVPPPPSTVVPPPPPNNTDASYTPGAADGARDKDGFLWDASIHASTKTTNKDGTWKKKKGVDASLVEQVQAHHRAAGLGTVAAVPPPPPAHVPLNGAPPPPPPTTAAADAVAQALASANAAKAGAQITEPTNFSDLCIYATTYFKADTIAHVCREHGLAGLGEVRTNVGKIKPIFDTFQTLRV